jgi:hypothetical protein
MGRALAALRPRAVLRCTVCGKEFTAWDRKTQQARTCSGACRVKLHRQSKQESPKLGRPLIEVLAEDE